MNEELRPDPLPKAIKTLTVAVWCLCVAVGAQVALYAWGYVRSMRWARENSSRSSSVISTKVTPIEEADAGGRPFRMLPPEEKIARASAILLTTYQDDGDRNKAIVAEILKQNPDTTLYYAVGEELPELSFAKEKGVSCGDGQVVFMTGSPASMSMSYGFTNGRIGGLGDMPLTKLREMVKQQKSPAKNR